jgi:hypothetical protein
MNVAQIIEKLARDGWTMTISMTVNYEFDVEIGNKDGESCAEHDEYSPINAIKSLYEHVSEEI